MQLVTPEEFDKLTRDGMYHMLKTHYPAAAVGLSRAKKSDLSEAYHKVYRLAEGYNTEGSVTGRFDHKPNNPERPWEEEKGYLTALSEADYEEVESRVMAAHSQEDDESDEDDVPEGRRTEIERKLSELPTALLETIVKWDELPEINRHTRRRKATIAKKLVRRLPQGVSLTEAVAVLSS